MCVCVCVCVCVDRALSLADDDQMADVWYNIGHIGISLGDLGLAYQVSSRAGGWSLYWSLLWLQSNRIVRSSPTLLVRGGGGDGSLNINGYGC